MWKEKNVTVMIFHLCNVVTCRAKRAEVIRMKPNVIYSSKVKEWPSQEESVVTTGPDTASVHVTH
jgi:hypothetical protein